MRYLLSLFLFCACSGLFAQGKILFPDQPVNWKDSTRLNISPDEDYHSFRILEPDLDQNVFVVGENHHYNKSNARLQLKLFKYLHKNTGLNTILLEFGYSRGWLVSKYIATGDTNLLQILDRYSFASYTRFYKGLRKYQEELGDADSIRVAGIDVERFNGLSVRILDKLLPKNKKIPDSLRITIESIKGLSGYNDHLYKQQEDLRDMRDNQRKRKHQVVYDLDYSIEEIIKKVNQYESQFEAYLGDNYSVFRKIIKELEDKVTYNEYVEKGMIQQYTYREEYMYQNFMKLYERDTTCKFMMQFGRCHAALSLQEEACGWYVFNAIAKRIAETERPGLQNKVATIGIFYPKSETFEANQEKYKQVRRMNNAAPDQALTFFSLRPDTTVTPEQDMSNQFHYIILNNLNPRDELDEKYFAEEATPAPSSDEPTFHFKAKAGFFERRYGKLNNFLLENGFTDTWLPEMTYGFGLAIENTNGFCFSWDHYIYANFNSSNSVGERVDMNGFTTLFYYGRNFSNKRWFSLTPYVGWGIGRTKIGYEADTQKSALFGENVSVAYTNPGLLASGMLSAKVNISFVSIGVEGGYIIDVSDPGWRADGEIVNESFSQRHSGYFVTGILSFYL